MQTFLPYKQFAKCAQVLDNLRLNKQILETYQIHRAAFGRRKAWRNHPAVVMWRGTKHHYCLATYGLHMCKEYTKRTGKVHAYEKKLRRLSYGEPRPVSECWELPNLTRQYRSLLLRKNPAHYRKYWPRLKDDIVFRWPNGTVGKN